MGYGVQCVWCGIYGGKVFEEEPKNTGGVLSLSLGGSFNSQLLRKELNVFKLTQNIDISIDLYLSLYCI